MGRGPARIGSKGLRGRGVVAALLVLAAMSAPVAGQDATWPREVQVRGGSLIVYQPQPEGLNGNELSSRAAAQYAPDDGEPIFGTLWFTSRIDADKEAGTVLVRDITVTRARWPDVTDSSEEEVTTYLTETFASVELPISYERLSSSLAGAEVRREGLEDLNNDPPVIIVVNELSELLQYDGQPRGVDIPDTDLEHIANAPYAVVRDKRSGTVYLSGGKLWYSAPDPMGPWTPIGAPPAEISSIVPPDTTDVPAPSPAPAIVTASEPTELVVTTGEPQWAPIGSGELLYVTNTETPLVRDVNAGQIYLLVSGRWYRSTSLGGPWTFARGDQLPQSFQTIEPDSDLGAVRVSVAGTPEAEDAVLDAQVPQTTAIDRSQARLEVTYDGDPQFVRIDGTQVEYAVNTGAQVLRIGGHYYACDDGVWFESAGANGPWAVADNVPSAEIAEIPPSAPVYNVTHVHVYDATPQVVYVGYTPGYLWSFPYYGVPVYGTGWYYPPYWGPRFYYPRFPTYGFHVAYNPWTGWSMGFSWSVGFMHVGVSFGGGYGGYRRPGWGPYGWRGGYYPPGGYRRPIVVNNNTTNINIGNRGGNTVNIGDRNNIYNRGDNATRNASQELRDRSRPTDRVRADRTAPGPNNVLSDREGNVYRRNENGSWDSREGREWRPTRPEAGAGAGARPSAPVTRPATPNTRPATPDTRPATRPAPSGVQRDYGSRVRGASRAGAAAQPRGARGRR